MELLEASFSLLQVSWGRLGGLLWPLGDLLGVSWGPLGSSCGSLGGILGPLGGLLGTSWGPLGVLFEPSWGAPGPPWEPPGSLSGASEGLSEGTLGGAKLSQAEVSLGHDFKGNYFRNLASRSLLAKTGLHRGIYRDSTKII